MHQFELVAVICVQGVVTRAEGNHVGRGILGRGERSGFLPSPVLWALPEQPTGMASEVPLLLSDPVPLPRLTLQGQCPVQSKFHLGLVLALPEACLTICVGLRELPGPSKIFHPFFPLPPSLSAGCSLDSSVSRENMT